jgi:hypothetical protein
MDRRGKGSSPQGTLAILRPTALGHEGTGFFYGYLIHNNDNDQAKRQYAVYLVAAGHVINDHAASGLPSIHIRLDGDGSPTGSKQSVATNSASCSPPDAVSSSSIAVRRHLESGASSRCSTRILDSGFLIRSFTAPYGVLDPRAAPLAIDPEGAARILQALVSYGLIVRQ